MAKWNEVLRIEESLGSNAVYAGCDAFFAPVAANLTKE
jgi:enolase